MCPGSCFPLELVNCSCSPRPGVLPGALEVRLQFAPRVPSPVFFALADTLPGKALVQGALGLFHPPYLILAGRYTDQGAGEAQRESTLF